MKYLSETATIPASEARTQFGNLMDQINQAHTVVAVERQDDQPMLLVAETNVSAPITNMSDAEWIAEMRSLREQLAPHLAANPIVESPEEIIRALRDS